MTRSELVAALSDKFNQLTLADADMSVRALLDGMASHLANGGRIEVRGFGAFSVNVRAPRLGRNPKTGENVNVPAKPAVQFKSGVELRNRVNSPGKRV